MAARFFAAGSVLAAIAQANPIYSNGTEAGHVVYTTEVVTAITTYCPAATTLTYGDKTYTVTEATTLTITDCPCTLTKPVAPTHSAVYQDECSKHCSMDYNICRTKHDANMSLCASEYASCLGYSPFGHDGSLVVPTACAEKPVETHYTTEVVTAITTYCPEPTTLTYGNNKTTTVTEAGTVTITDCPCTISKPMPHPSKPAGKPPVALTTTTIIPGVPGVPEQTKPVQPEEPAQPEVTKPAQPEHTAAVPGNDCPAECSAAYDGCRGAADANMSTCAAEYASCLGYNPFGEDGSLIAPTACSSAVTGDVTVPATEVPVVTPGVSEVPTAGAGRVVPGALVVLGAIALL